MQVVVGHVFQYGTAQASANDTVLYGDDMCEVAAHIVQYLFIDRLQETHVVVSHAYALSLECKYRNEKVGVDTLETLRNRASLVRGFDGHRYAIYSKGGFTRNLSESGDVELYTLDEVLHPSF